MLKRVIILTLTLLCLAATALAAQSGDFEYELQEDKTVIITRYTGTAEHLEVPAKIKKRAVTALAEKSFFDCDTLVTVRLPGTLTKIIDNPFYDCGRLTDITVAPGDGAFQSVFGILYNKETAALICYPAGRQEKSCAVAQGTRIITDHAFYDCRALETLCLPNTLLAIGQSAFVNCDGFTRLTLPEGLQQLGELAFANCGRLTRVDLPDSLTRMGYNPFYNCGRLTQVNVSDDHPLLTTAKGVLYNRQNMSLVCYPAGLETEEYKVLNNVKIIGTGAFGGSRHLKSVILPDSLTAIYGSAFQNCSSLESVALPDGLEKISAGAFKNCEALTRVVIPGQTQVNDGAFEGCPHVVIERK